MKINHLILASVLFVAATACPSAQAGLWDWCSAPIYWIASCIRAQMPITNAKLDAFKQEQKQTTAADIKTISDREVARQQACDNEFGIANSKHNDVVAQADELDGNLLLVQGEARNLKQVLGDLEETRKNAMQELEQENRALKKELAVQLAIVKELKENQLKAQQSTDVLGKQLTTAQQKLAEICGKNKQSTAQAQEHATRITGISDQLQNLNSSEQKLRINLGNLMQTRSSITMSMGSVSLARDKN